MSNGSRERLRSELSGSAEVSVRAASARDLRARLVDPSDGRIGHAELEIGGNRLFISDEHRDFGAISPDTLGGSPVKLHLQVPDAAAFVAHEMT